MKTIGISAVYEVAVCVPSLRALALALTGDRRRADDLVEEAINWVLGGSELAPPGTKVKVWMFTILHQLHRAALMRTQAELRSIGDGIADAPVTLASEGRLASGDFRRAFWRLGDEEREVLILEAANNLSREDIANVCGVTARLIDMRASRARHTLLRTLSAARARLRRSPAVLSREITTRRAGRPAR